MSLDADSKRLASYYMKHHEDGERYGYLYQGEERGRIFKKWVGQGKMILDLGCRDGILSRFYAQGNQIVGVDIDAKALAICSKQLGIQTLWCDVNKPLPFEPSSFDCIVAGEIIEHLFYPEIFLEEVVRVLKPDGLFVGSTPNTFRLRNRWKFLIGQEYETDRTHLHRFSFQSIKKLLERHFVDVITIPCGGCLFGGGKTGIPITARTPRFVAELFAAMILWNAKGLGK